MFNNVLNINLGYIFKINKSKFNYLLHLVNIVATASYISVQYAIDLPFIEFSYIYEIKGKRWEEGGRISSIGSL